jgi:hypothetical protein
MDAARNQSSKTEGEVVVIAPVFTNEGGPGVSLPMASAAGWPPPLFMAGDINPDAGGQEHECGGRAIDMM